MERINAAPILLPLLSKFAPEVQKRLIMDMYFNQLLTPDQTESAIRVLQLWEA